MTTLERYTSSAMRNVFSEERRFQYLLEAACIAAEVTDTEMGLGGKLRQSARSVREVYLDDRLTDQTGPWLAEWKDLEEKYHHDMAAFVEVVRNRLPRDVAQYFHLGRTSSDLVDTALAFQVTDAQTLVDQARRRLCRDLALRAWRNRDVPIRARTHGQYAEATTVGRRLAVLATQIWSAGLDPYRFGKMTGPVGVNSPLVGHVALSHVGLRQPPTTQIVPRIHLARLMADIEVATVPVSELAELIRLGSRSGEAWCQERSGGTKGSSSMPTKVNPVRSEKVSGLCLWIRSSAGAVIQAGAGLWEERDISHSSVERVAIPNLFAALEHVYDVMAEVARDMRVLVTGAHEPEITSAVALREIVRAGASYDAAYTEVQREGPRMAMVDAGLDPDQYVSHYDSRTEQEMWDLVHQLSTLRQSVVHSG